MSKKVSALLLGLSLVSFSAMAEEYAGEGTVNAIKGKKLSITHGPIKGLMDGMTMDFAVADPAMIEEVAAGNKIKFTLEKDKTGNLIISDLEVMKGGKK